MFGSELVEGEFLQFRITMTGSGLDMSSAGKVNINAGNATSFNGFGGTVEINAGNGLNRQGGRGGSMFLRGGNATGEMRFGGALADGGGMYIFGGQSVE